MQSFHVVLASMQLPTLETGVRLTLHVFAAAIFVGGQFTLAGLVPSIRGLGEGATKVVARAFGRLQWPAYALLIATGFWNVFAMHTATASHDWIIVLTIKIVVSLLAVSFAFLHQRARSRSALAAYCGLAGLAALVALVLGVLLSA